MMTSIGINRAAAFGATLIVAAFCVLPTAHALNSGGLVGTWQAQPPQGPLILIIQADNRLIYDGSPAAYTLVPGAIRVQTDSGAVSYPYTLKDDVLLIRYPNGYVIEYRRVAADTRNMFAENDNRLFRLLTRSAWCSFSFRGGGQYSRTGSSRIRFYPNGTYRYGSRREGHFSGRETGSGYDREDGSFYSSQSNAAADGRWEVQNGRLFMCEGNGPMEEIDLKVTYNSSGHPILKSEGKEYCQCD